MANFVAFYMLCYIMHLSICTPMDREAVIKEINNLLDDDTLNKLNSILHKSSNDEAIKCEDDPAAADACPHWKKGGACENNRETMKMYCRKTCEDCKAALPPIPDIPECAKTTYGCCWDNVTSALGPTDNIVESRCSPCLDAQSKTFCTNWKSDCSSKIEGQGDVMRHLCPVTCGVPCDYNLNVHKCRDDPENANNCIGWYDEGKCTTEQAKMRVLCPSMCGFCRGQ